MNKDDIYSIWAPDDSIWSPWVKPVLFAFMEIKFDDAPASSPPLPPPWLPSAASETAIVLDLPGDIGVWLALDLAARGFRPVPLYNSVPAWSGDWEGLDPTAANQTLTAVNVLPILKALRDGAATLATQNLPVEAPPVFLLDANRRGDGKWLGPGKFDNRAVCFTTDFPSANFLMAHGIKNILLIQQAPLLPHTDLTHVLCRWQESGIQLQRAALTEGQPPAPFKVSRPSWYGLMFQRALSVIGLSHTRGGSFGGWVPEPGSGG